MLKLIDVKKAYDERLILHIPKLDIPAGNYWVKGNNGSGKTSLMKIIAGMSPFQGTVMLNNIDLRKNPMAYRQQVSYAEAEPVFPGFVTGWELIRFVQKTRKENDEQVDTLVDHFAIRHFLVYPVGTYSSGMTKKLSLLLAFIGQPKLVLLDELLITLDDSFLPILFSQMQLMHSRGTSFLLSSHQALPENLLTPILQISVENQTAHLSES